MPVALASWPEAAFLLTGSALHALGFWTAGYVLLSLSLALIWITLVTVVQHRQTGQAISASYMPPCSATLRFSFEGWQRENYEFSRHLGRLEGSLNAAGLGATETVPAESSSPTLTKSLHGRP
jgi:hypothetical protein